MTGHRDRHWDSDNRFENKITRFIDDFLGDAKTKFRSVGSGGGDGKWVPAIDVTENEREYTIIADLPGVNKEDVDIEFHDSILVISGNHKHESVDFAPQEINVKQQKTDPNFQPNQQQTDQYQQTQQSHQQRPTEHQSNQQTTEFQSNKQPTEYQSNQQPTEYQTNQQQYHQQQQPTSQNDQRRGEYQEFHRLNKSQQTPQTNGNQGTYEKLHIQERRYGPFSRSIQLPTNIRNDVDFNANLENGVLKIRVPKNSEKPKRKIRIS
ncbi:19448_t:CDS:2 [Funneliformis geosporum]|uniref:3687_t:CDS:1 n=1 Tax=Funneliformis geosporum TaxID=1117311 RepID=A0A9W4SJC5_9GLOM|nr:19448_t:CDS:2 [Funneliformis geosporum]CAI2170399.1 3687_t:CDS:2 [Funneliformis geosporum]